MYANVLVTHSTTVQPGEFVLIEGIDIPQEMVIALIRSVRKAGGIPLVELKQERIQREIILGGDDAGIKLSGEYEAYRSDFNSDTRARRWRDLFRWKSNSEGRTVCPSCIGTVEPRALSLE